MAKRPSNAPGPDQPALTFPATPTKKRGRSPEETAQASVARAETAPSGRVKLVLTLFLPRTVAEHLAARAIREGRNQAAVVTDILEAGASIVPPRG